MRGELLGSAQHGIRRHGCTMTAGDTAGEGRGRHPTAFISSKDGVTSAERGWLWYSSMTSKPCLMVPGAHCRLGATCGAALWSRGCYRPVLPIHLLTLLSSLGITLTMDGASAPATALCVTPGPAAAVPASWHDQSPPSAPRVSLWNDRPAKKIESPFL